jgi:hypothetical protein
VTTLVVPRDDGTRWPTLGPQVWQFLLERCVHGPGDLKGQPFEGDAEKQAIVYRIYEVYPQGHRMAGRRRFKQADISVRKGTAKTELAAAIAFAELHPEGPVRCDGWDAAGNPVGTPVRDPYIPMLATTEEQVAELAYGALLVMCQEGPDADLFDAGLDRILRLRDGKADGKAEPVSTSPDGADGARTTFQHFDETHRLRLPRVVHAWETMLQNVPKRVRADAWSLGTTTTYTPGEGSVAEITHQQAERIHQGEVDDPTVFFFHREADVGFRDLDDPEVLRAAIRDASGPAIASWEGFESQVEGIARLYHQAKARGNKSYFERVWLNRRKAGDARAFDVRAWAALGGHEPPRRGAKVTLGLDGSRWRDGTGLVVTDLSRMVQWKYGLWLPQPVPGTDHDEVDVDAVDAGVDDLFERFEVVRFYFDPAQGWDKRGRVWAEKHGPKRVVEFYTDSRGAAGIGRACRSYHEAITGAELGIVDDEEFERHIGAACRRDLKIRDEDGQPLWTVEKESRDSTSLIDLSVCAVLSYKAALDAIKAGERMAAEPQYAYVM